MEVMFTPRNLVEDNPDRHPSTLNLLKWLTPNPNLSGHMAGIAHLFADFVNDLMDELEKDSPEITAGLRHLLEAKDCFVRAAVDETTETWNDR